MNSADFSIQTMFLQADPVVQGVMVVLFLASLLTWVFIVEKGLVLRRFRQDMQLLARQVDTLDPVRPEAAEFPLMTQDIALAGIRESRDEAGEESRADFRERVERAMRDVFYSRLHKAGNRTTFLASVGSSSPFIGLFGTVWGIMHSFAGIAASGETTLAIIAPGIAEALFATAMGLVAAIPAVLGYNAITRTMKDITAEAFVAIGNLGNALSKAHFQQQNGPDAFSQTDGLV